MRPIDADALSGKFAERFDDACEQMRTRSNKDYWNGVSTGVNWGKKTVADAPTVDVQPVIHGRWVLLGIGGYAGPLCSVCQDKMSWFLGKATRYCPNCGAKMDGGEVDGR